MKKPVDRDDDADGNRRALFLSLLGLGAVGAAGCVAQAADNQEPLGRTTEALWFGQPTLFNTIGTAGEPLELRTVMLNNSNFAVAAGFWVPGDGGGGVFFWDPSSVEADDGGTVIKVIGITTGRWKRVYSGPLNVRWFGAKGDGVADDGAAITAALGCVRAIGGAVYLPQGTYTYATSPNFAFSSTVITPLSNTRIFGEPGTILKCTGGGHAFILDGGASGAGVNNMTIENLIVQGTGTDTANDNGIFVRAISRSRFLNLHVGGAAANAVLIVSCEANLWTNLVISSNEPISLAQPTGLYPVPVVGVYVDPSAGTAHQTFLNPVVQGVSSSGMVGMVIDRAYAITVIGGTIDNNNVGVIITSNETFGGGNSFHGTSFANAVDDLQIYNHNTLLSNIMANAVVRVRGASGIASDTCLMGGQIRGLTIETGAYRTRVMGAFIQTLNDQGTNTIYQQAWNGAAGAMLTDVVPCGSAAALVTPTLADSTTIDARLGNIFVVVATMAGQPFTIANPSNATMGQVITITVKNATGGALGTVTWGSSYKMAAWTAPPSGFNASIDFYFDGTSWFEKSRTAQAPN
jgi:hypothetical protein